MAWIKKLSLLAAAVWSIAAYPVVHAALITITDLTDGQPTFAASGVPFSGCDSSTPEALNCFAGSLVPNGISVDTRMNIFLYEDAAHTILSDVLTIDVLIHGGSEGLHFFFNSDSDIGSLVRPGSMDFVATETGSAQLFDLPSFCTECPDFTISLTSDVESRAPEPASLALLGLGLAGLGFSRCRKIN